MPSSSLMKSLYLRLYHAGKPNQMTDVFSQWSCRWGVGAQYVESSNRRGKVFCKSTLLGRRQERYTGSGLGTGQLGRAHKGMGVLTLTIVSVHIGSCSAANEVHRIVSTEHRYGILLAIQCTSLAAEPLPISTDTGYWSRVGACISLAVEPLTISTDTGYWSRFCVSH